MTSATSASVPWRAGRLPFVVAIGLASAGVAALRVFAAPYPHEPPLYGFLGLALIFAAGLALCVWRMTLSTRMSRWTALYFLTATMLIPVLDPIVGMANRLIYLPVYVAALLGAYLITKWALRPPQR